MKLWMIAILILAVGHAALACLCKPAPPPDEALKNASAVFIGTVKEIERVGGEVAVTFTAQRAWKGIEGKTILVFTGQGGEDCGYRFEMGKSYLVYAIDEGVKFHTSICMRTCHIDKAGDDLKALGEGKAIEVKK